MNKRERIDLQTNLNSKIDSIQRTSKLNTKVKNTVVSYIVKLIELGVLSYRGIDEQ